MRKRNNGIRSEGNNYFMVVDKNNKFLGFIKKECDIKLTKTGRYVMVMI